MDSQELLHGSVDTCCVVLKWLKFQTPRGCSYLHVATVFVVTVAFHQQESVLCVYVCVQCDWYLKTFPGARQLL